MQDRSSDDRPTICVLVPTFKRPADLRRCLLAITAQQRPADEFIVVVRDIDVESQNVIRDSSSFVVPPVKMILIDVPGQVQALDAGARAAVSDIVAITDDDATPHADWVARIVELFASDAKIGGVGGRDLMRVNGRLLVGRRNTVGRVPAFGRQLGNHHLGYGPVREVDVLKGVNGSYRRKALLDVGFDSRLRGTGAQVHWEISLGLALKRRGWKLVYDPEILVDHFLAPRFDEDQRNSFNPLALSNSVFNETFIRLEHRSRVAQVLFVIGALLIGTRAAPGFVQCIRFFPANPALSVKRFTAAIKGRLDAFRAISSPDLAER